MAARRSGIGGVIAGASLPTGPERRRSTRIDSGIRASVRQAELPDAAPSPARLLDISDTGLCMEVRRRMSMGERVVLDLECELPLRVHLGFDADALVIDGPMHTHVVRVAGVVMRTERTPSRRWQVGVQLCPDTTRFDELQAVRYYVDHLREQESWTI